MIGLGFGFLRLSQVTFAKAAGGAAADDAGKPKASKPKGKKTIEVKKEVKKPERKKGPDGKPLPPAKKQNNFFDLAFKFSDYGIGKQFRRSIWENPNNYWTVTRVKITNLTNNCKRGKAWGLLTWRGVTEERERQINGLLKRQWRFAKPDPNYIPPVKPQPIGW